MTKEQKDLAQTISIANNGQVMFNQHYKGGENSRAMPHYAPSVASRMWGASASNRQGQAGKRQ